MRECRAVHASARAERSAELDLIVGGNDGNWNRSGGAGNLDGLAAESTGATPYEHDVAFADRMRQPAVEHAIRGRAHEHVGGGGLPREMRRLRQTLVRLYLRELREAPPVGLVAPDPERRAEHRILAGLGEGAITIPLAAMDHDGIADLQVGDVMTDLVHNARRIGTADVKILARAGLLPRLDDVDGTPDRRPDVVVVDSRGHHIDQHLVRRKRRHFDLLDAKGLRRRAEPFLADELRKHPARHLADRRHLADFVGSLTRHRASTSRQDQLGTSARLGTSPPHTRSHVDRQILSSEFTRRRGDAGLQSPSANI